jgi:cytoskeleton protein RodZ
MKKTGEILRKAREEKGLSLNEIGLSLKISSKVLKAIEEGNERQLPAKTFLRGFVQSYANYLHLDTDKILEIFY